MGAIQPLTEASDPKLADAARHLFRAYAAFLREIVACHAFNFTRFEDEIATLPIPYSSHNGDLLLALAAPDTPIGCVAFRAATSGPEICELKRLFVLPAHRGHGVAEELVRTALDRARSRGYRTAILDTEPSTMQAAQGLYLKLGFGPYVPSHPHNPVDVLYLRRALA